MAVTNMVWPRWLYVRGLYSTIRHDSRWARTSRGRGTIGLIILVRRCGNKRGDCGFFSFFSFFGLTFAADAIVRMSRQRELDFSRRAPGATKKKANNARASCPCRALGCCLARWGWRNGSLSGDRASRGRWGALHVSWFHGLGHVLRRICLRFVLYCIVCTAIQYVTYRITDRKAVVHRPSYQSRHPPILQKGRNGETTIHSAPHRDGPTWHSTAARSSRDIGSATATIAAHPRGHPPHRESDVASRAATGSSRGPPVLEAAG